MSQNNTPEDTLAPLSAIFADELDQSNGNTPQAFVEVLDELDRRHGDVEQHLVVSTNINKQLITALEEITTTHHRLPLSIQETTKRAISVSLPDIERKSHLGAYNAQESLREAVQALKGATEAKEAQSQRLTYFLAYGLPAALCVAIGLSFLFGSYVIRYLPQQWKWTCAIIGAQHIDQENGDAYCIIRK